MNNKTAENNENYMSLVIDKHNGLTDAITGNVSLSADKLINVIYHFWQESGSNIFEVELIELKRKLNMSSEDYVARITSALEELTLPISLRDFDYEGKTLKYHRSAFIKELNIWKDRKKYIQIEISPVIIKAFEQKNGFTALDINVCNQFRTKYGLHTYYIFKRYERLPNKLFPNKGYVLFSLDDLNNRFGSSFKTKSEMKRSIERGIKEIKKITGVDITVLWQPMYKKFSFSWNKVADKQLWRTDFRKFISHMRKNYVNIHLLTANVNNKVTLISIAPNGHIYDLKHQNTIDAKTSQRIWDYMFNNQNKIEVFKDYFQEDLKLLEKAIG